MLRTRHSSSEGVRTYNRTNEQVLEQTSDILNSKKCKATDEEENVPPVIETAVEVTETSVKVTEASEASSIPMALNMNSCNVTINIHKYPGNN
jgi:cell division septation protein DedD